MSGCTCAWNPVQGWIVCRSCCNSGASCTHLLEDLEDPEDMNADGEES